MKIRNILLFWLTLSVFLHITTILTFKIFSENKITAKPEKTIEVVVMDDQKADPTLVAAKQIVEQDEKPVNDEIDANTKYLSQFNQKVVKQTVAALTGKYNNTAGRGLKKSDTKEVKKDQTKNFAKDVEKDDGYKLEKFMPKMDWAAMAQKNLGGDGQEASHSSDYLKDVAKGPQTVLSTKEFLYYTYFKRIRTKIEQYWEPSIKGKVEKLMSQGRKIASTQNRITKLLIILNTQGTLMRVKVLSESGIQDLDDAGIEAFKSAAPFPNPPSGLVEKDGTIRIRYDFVLET